jgi:cytochrome c-type biogenesis protein CcmH
VKRFSDHIVRKIAAHDGEGADWLLRSWRAQTRGARNLPQAGNRTPAPVRAAALIRRILGRRSDRLKKILVLVFTVAVMSASSAAHAVQPDEIMADPVKEARARELSGELRCMVCQNQSIDDSEAPLARDLRLLVRERISAGDSDAQVIDFLVARYGEFVLLKPRLEPHTLLLWLLPPLVLAGSGLALWMHSRRSRPAVPDVTLTPDEEARLSALVADEASPEKPV